MTREEAINIMNVIVHMLEEKYDTDRVEEAVDMAIDALETIGHLTDRPCNVCEFHGENGCCKWDCVFKGGVSMTREEYARSRSWILKVIRDRCELTRAETDYLNDLIEVIDQIPNLKDAYDKGYKDGQKALAVHLELCKEEGNCDYYDSYNQTCRRSDVPKEPCEDCISREEVCDYIAEFVNHEYATDREHEMVEHIIGGIQHLPSIQPKQKMVEPQESEDKE